MTFPYLVSFLTFHRAPLQFFIRIIILTLFLFFFCFPFINIIYAIFIYISTIYSYAATIVCLLLPWPEAKKKKRIFIKRKWAIDNFMKFLPFSLSEQFFNKWLLLMWLWNVFRCLYQMDVEHCVHCKVGRCTMRLLADVYDVRFDAAELAQCTHCRYTRRKVAISIIVFPW